MRTWQSAQPDAPFPYPSKLPPSPEPEPEPEPEPDDSVLGRELRMLEELRKLELQELEPLRGTLAAMHHSPSTARSACGTGCAACTGGRCCC